MGEWEISGEKTRSWRWQGAEVDDNWKPARGSRGERAEWEKRCIGEWWTNDVKIINCSGQGAADSWQQEEKPGRGRRTGAGGGPDHFAVT
jgi:hypothetical protein